MSFDYPEEHWNEELEAAEKFGYDKAKKEIVLQCLDALKAGLYAIECARDKVARNAQWLEDERRMLINAINALENNNV